MGLASSDLHNPAAQDTIMSAEEAYSQSHIAREAIKRKDEAEKQLIDPQKVNCMVDLLRRRINSDIRGAILKGHNSISTVYNHSSPFGCSQCELRAVGEEIRSAYVDAGYNISELEVKGDLSWNTSFIALDWKNILPP